ncbi:MAG: hydrogenase 3 maturation endopeptidase HyCI [Candidatus Bathyarchaeota archaeon]|nr:hydrogenase 3 maturation endopeptidase HyCI [Candidatus Bathyarchaeota archaeon]
MSYDFENELARWLKNSKTVVIAGIGNPIRFDDFVGVKIVQDLQGHISKNVHLIECETVPESFMDEIIELKPSHVLLIDAAIMQLSPGEVRLFDADKVANFPAISTHMLPLRVFCEYITKMSGGKLALLLIEPKKFDFGEGLTAEVEKTAEKIVKVLKKLLP